MYIDTSIFFGLVAIVIILFVVVFYLLGKSRARSQAVSSGHVLSEAERESEKIVRESVEKAQETLMDAQYIKDDLMQGIESSMRSIAESAIVSFQEETQKTHKRFLELFGDVQEQYKQETQKTVNALEQEAEGEMDEFRRALGQEIVDSQRRADVRADEAYQKVLGELEGYKQKKMAELDTQVKSMIDRVFREVLGRSLTSEDHEKLVVEALTRAKEDGLIGARSYAPVKN